MSSLRQIAANRRNAIKSTGPTTSEGKERSRGNALRHGLTAETVIAPLEDAEDYQAFEAAVTADYDAQTAVERELVLRLASILWRLRRATGIESALFETVVANPQTTEPDDPEQSPSRPALVVVGTNPSEQNRLRVEVDQQPETAPQQEPNSDAKTSIANGFLQLMAPPTFPLDRLSRYEHTLWRQARQIIVTLEAFGIRGQQSNRLRFPFSFRMGGR
jgi:hypothetical protein